MAALKYILPAVFALYFIFLFLVRSIAVSRQIGKSPVVLSKEDNAHGLIAKYFSAWMLLLGLYVAVFSCYPSAYGYFLPIPYLQLGSLEATGIIILILALVWTYAAQVNMRKSWRIGIDEQQKTELVTTGIFSFSRNPIYVGMMAAVTGLFLVTPNGFTLLLMAMGYVLIQIQVRLEEEFLLKMHGQSYSDYRRGVRRFI
ncbi:MAG: putative transrane protein of unknown function [Bacteroidota bacterium]|nr:putative transrane protein of unknown function [Bacteroidota bacterium]